MLDGFFFLHENEEMRDKSLDFNDRMTRLCLETRAPFLTLTYDSCASLNHFVINRPDDRPCPLEKQYLGTKIPQWGWQIGSNTVTQFKETEVKTPLLNKGSYRGDKGLYESFRQNGLLHYPDLDCYPLQEKDANL